MSLAHRVSSSARRQSFRPLRALTLTGGALVIAAALSGPALAAPPQPQAAAQCWGSLAKAPTKDEPNQLQYGFKCDSRITAYTVLANRAYDLDTIENFSTDALVLDLHQNVVSNQSFTCEGTLPGNGVNCNAGPGGFSGALNSEQGHVSLDSPYCKSLPVKGKPGQRAIPQALVQLIVTDTTGAQSGPFRLRPARFRCKAVPDTVPAKKKAPLHRGSPDKRPRK